MRRTGKQAHEGLLAPELAEGLQAGFPDLVSSAIARAHAVADPAGVEDPEYHIGLRKAAEAALRYAIDGLGTLEPPPVPAELLAQARAAARNGVSLDTVLRRYFAGYTLLSDHLAAECGDAELRRVQRGLAALLDRLLVAVSEEYRRGLQSASCPPSTRRLRQVRMLLAGDPADPRGLGYEIEAWHLAAITSGPGAVDVTRELAAALGRRCLVVRPEGQLAWAWLGGEERLSARETLRLAEQTLPATASIAIGEAARDLSGWRLSHRQAKATMGVLTRHSGRLLRYGEVSLLLSALRDDLLASSLAHSYLSPLRERREDGAILLATVRAYLKANRNLTSAAASLGVTRQTVSARLRVVEKTIDATIDSCAADLEVAVQLWSLGDAGTQAPMMRAHT